MEAIIKIQEKDGRQAVSARELHGFLGSQRKIENWIQERIEKYGLVEKQDYEVLEFYVNGNLLNDRLNKWQYCYNELSQQLGVAVNGDLLKRFPRYYTNLADILQGLYISKTAKKLRA